MWCPFAVQTFTSNDQSRTHTRVQGALSCAHWLSWACGIDTHTVREKVRVARALTELPLLSEALAKGELGYSKVRALTRSGANSGVSIENGTLRIEKMEAGVPNGTGDLVLDLYRRIPDARITDILLEVDDATRFTEAFTHLRTGAPCRDRVGLLTPAWFIT